MFETTSLTTNGFINNVRQSVRLESEAQVLTQGSLSGRAVMPLEPCQVERYFPLSSCGRFNFYTHRAANLQDQSFNTEDHTFPKKYMPEGVLAQLNLKQENLFSIHDELELEGGDSSSFWQYFQQHSATMPEHNELECLLHYFRDYPDKLKRLQQAPVLAPWDGYFSQRNSPWLYSVITQLFLLLKENEDGYIAVIHDETSGNGRTIIGGRQLNPEEQAQRPMEQWAPRPFRHKATPAKPLRTMLDEALANHKASPDSQQKPVILSDSQLGQILSRISAPSLTRKKLVDDLVKLQSDVDQFSTDDLRNAFFSPSSDPQERLYRAWTLYKGGATACTDLIALKSSLLYLVRERLDDPILKQSNNNGQCYDSWLVNTINHRIHGIDDVLDCIAAFRGTLVGHRCLDLGDERVKVTAVSLANFRKFVSFLKESPLSFRSYAGSAPTPVPCDFIACKPLDSEDTARGVFYISTGNDCLAKGVEEVVRESPITARELCNIGQNGDISTRESLDCYLQFSANCIYGRPAYLGVNQIEFTALFSRSEVHQSLMTMISQVCGYDLMHPLLSIKPVPVVAPAIEGAMQDSEDVHWLPIKRSFRFLSDNGVKAIAQQTLHVGDYKSSVF